MRATLVRVVVVVFLLLFLPGNVQSDCPQQVPHSCSCENYSAGLYIKCSRIGVDLAELLHSLGDLQVQRLTVNDASWQKVSRVPSAKVHSLHLTSCGISSIEKNAFDELAEHLDELVLNNNSLTLMPVLGSLPRLLSLNLNNNRLSNISEGSLRGIGNLKHLRVEGNEICALSRNALKEVKGTLELLDLSDNCLTRFPASNLRNSLGLMYLDLSHNHITHMDDSDLINLPLLKELRMNDNVITRISPKTLMNVPQLQYLYLKNNTISAMDSSTFGALKHLEVLDISHNILTEIPNTKTLSNIRQIRLDSNRISNVARHAFSGNSKLQLINLQNNEIRMISQNGFDELDKLSILIIANNSIEKLEAGMLEGMTGLQQLNVRNNSLTELSNATFSAVPLLTTLDVAHNALQHIQPSVLSTLNKLLWLELSYNRLSSLHKGTFNHRIPNIILYGNRFDCDSELDWLAQYISLNQVRTSLPHQQEVACATPQKYAGVLLKELMKAKLDETVRGLSSQLHANVVGQDLLGTLLPNGMRGLFQPLQLQPNPLADVPVLGALSRSVPSLRFLPGIDLLPKAQGERVQQIHKLNDAIEQFSAPLVRLSAGGKPLPSDYEQMIRSIPKLIVSAPGLENIDVTKLPPAVITHVLRGGQIPGIEKEKLDKLVRGFVEHMHAAAEAANKGHPIADESRYLPSLDKLPQELVTGFVNGQTIPYLNEQQMAAITKYYTAKLLAMSGDSSSANVLSTKLGLPQELVEMVKLLPPGYDISQIPKEVMESVGRGEIPNFSLLPADLQQYFIDNSQRLLSSFSNKPDVTLDEILNNLPQFERPVRSTFSPYDLSKIDGDLVIKMANTDDQRRMYRYAAIILGLIALVTLTLISVVCVHMRRKKLCVVAEQRSIVQQWRLAPASSSPKEHSRVSFTDAITTPNRRSRSHLSDHECV